MGVFGAALTSQRRRTCGGWDVGGWRPTLRRKKRDRTPLPGGAVTVRGSDRKSQSILQPVSRRAVLANLFSARRRSNFADLLGNTRTYNGMVDMYQHTHISVKIAPRPSPKGAQKGVGGPGPGRVGGVWWCSDIPARPNMWGVGRGGPAANVAPQKERSDAPPGGAVVTVRDF